MAVNKVSEIQGLITRITNLHGTLDHLLRYSIGLLEDVNLEESMRLEQARQEAWDEFNRPATRSA